MTLILSQAGWRWALQVSDRLVSKIRQGTSSPHDFRANKTVVFISARGVASLSYSGLSYVGTLPTDEWIAQAIAGEPYPKNDEGNPFLVISGHGSRPWPTLQQALSRVRTALDALWRGPHAGDLTRVPITIEISGWLLSRSNPPRPLLARISGPPGGPYALRWGQRLRGSMSDVTAFPNHGLDGSRLAELLPHRNDVTLSHVLRSAVSLIRQVAVREPTVGTDCVSVTISPLAYREVLIGYHPESPSVIVVDQPSGPEPVPVQFSPWILSPMATMAPAMFPLGDGTEIGVGSLKGKHLYRE